jgi:hypothetical protein
MINEDVKIVQEWTDREPTPQDGDSPNKRENLLGHISGLNRRSHS